MPPPVEALRAQLEPFCHGLAERQLAHLLGGPLQLRPVVERFRGLYTPDVFMAVSEAASAGVAGDGQPHALRLLRRFLALTGARLRGARAEVEAAALLATGTVEVGHQLLPWGEAEQVAAESPHSGRRAAAACAVAAFLEAHPAPFVAQHEALQRTAGLLGHGAVLPFLEAVDAPLEPLRDEAAALLAHTEDGFRDVLGWVLHKVDARLEPKRARWHDLLHAAPMRTLGVLRREELLPLVDRWLAEQGLPLHGQGHVERLAVPHRGGPGRAGVVALRVPSEVKLVHALGGGLADAARLLHAHGQAVALSHRGAALPAELRLAADGGLLHAAGTAFERLLADERWLRRYVGLSAHAARDAARAAAFWQLLGLRRACGRLQWAVGLHASGSLEQAADAFTEHLSRACGVAVERGEWLRALPGAHAAADALRGAGLESVLHGTFLQRFGDDHFRNPAAGAEWRMLLGLAPREGVEGLLRLLGADAGAGALRGAGTRLLAVLNA
jgi:hypothetical protein